MRRITDGDLSRALSLLPTPLFRHRDIDDVCRQLGQPLWRGQALWTRLAQDGLIVRTNVPIGKASTKFYWERVPAAMPQHEARTQL